MYIKFHLTIAPVMIKARLFALFPLNPSRMLLWKSVLSPETLAMKFPN